MRNHEIYSPSFTRMLGKVTAVLLSSVLCASQLQAAEIKVGMSTALSGPASALGKGVKLGVEAVFHKVNSSGGINGNTLKLVAMDDGYEPMRAAPNMHDLVAQDVVAVIGNVGTPTAIVSVPIANESKTLLFGAFTGAGVLRQTPPDRYVINYRASYAEETGAMVKGLLEAGVKPEEIAFFTQNDGYGDAGYKGAVKALKAQGFEMTDTLVHGRYERNTRNVEEALSDILDAEVEPKAVIMVGAYGPCAEFIKLAREDLPETLFFNVSFVGSQALKKELGDQGEGVIITQVVPHYDAQLPGVAQYKQDLKNYSPDAQPSFVSLEGYLAARVFIEGLKKVQGDVTSDAIVDALEGLSNLDLGLDFPISYSAEEHQASHKVWPTVIKNGRFEAMAWGDLSIDSDL